MTKFFEELAAEFAAEGLNQKFNGTPLISMKVTLGKTIDENGNYHYFMVNPSNRVVYEFKNAEQAKTVFQMIFKGI